MLDPLIDRKNRQIAGPTQATVGKERLQTTEHAHRPIRPAVHPGHEVGPWQVQVLLRDGTTLMRQQADIALKDRLDP